MPLILFLLSSIVLTLEILETKVFSYSLENGLIFLVVGMVLLGFGAGGSVLSLRRELGDPRPLVRRALIATAVLLVAAHAWFARTSDHLDFRLDGWTISIIAALSAPYVSAGMAVAALLADERANVHARYGVNLLGSAAGCVVVFFVLGPLTAPQCLVACAAGAALLAVPLAERRLPLLAVIVAAGAPLFWFADDVLPYRIQKAATGGQLALIRQHAAEVVRTVDDVQAVDVRVEFDRWDPTARVQVHSLQVETTDPNVRADLERLPSMWFTQDSSYGSPLIGRGVNPDGTAPVYERTCYGLGYFRGRPRPEVLIIGLGGAPDVQTALHHDAASITGVDINATTVGMVRGPMAAFLGDPYADPRVEIVFSDGRSYVRSNDRRYDLIQLSGVDTKSVLASGTLALNESYLYTREAMGEYLDHLADDGMLCVLYAGKFFMHRLTNTVFEALAARGAERPEQHVALIEQAQIFGLLVKRTPFDAEETDALAAWLDRADAGDGATDGATGIVVMVYELLSPALSLNVAPKAIWIPGRPTTDALVLAQLEGRRAEFVEAYRGDDGVRRDIRPAPDWRPFFFHDFYHDDVWKNPPRHFQRMLTLLAVMAGFAVVLILGPLIPLGLRGMPVLSCLPFALYFACLGTGYIMAMSGLIQRYVLFLGHQSHAFATVIGGLLVAAGIGSIVAGRFVDRAGRVMAVAVAAICVMLVAVQLALDPLFSLTASLPLAARVGLSLLVLLPLGIPLGMMFPTGLALVKRRSPLFVPWAFGINGVFSVIGTSIVLPGAILYGFPAMAGGAAALYVVALLVGLPLARR